MECKFETLESAHDFVVLLAETVAEAKSELERDVAREFCPSRRLDALRIALYNLNKLENHVSQTGRILNDLRSLRRLLFDKRREASYTPRSASVAPLPLDDKPQISASVDESVAA